MTDRTSGFWCQHPLAQRRLYDGLRVCRECLDVKTGDGPWGSSRRLLRGTGSGRIELLSESGVLLAKDWRRCAERG